VGVGVEVEVGVGVAVGVEVDVEVAVVVGVDVGSSSTMVNVTGLGIPIAAFVGSERVNHRISSPSRSASPRIGTMKIVVVTPGVNVTVPIAVR